MKINDLTTYLELLAPLHLQESYDNCGLLTGEGNTEISKALITLDCTEDVVQEAIDNGCNLVVAHHPVIFGGLKKLNGKNYVERTVIKAIRNNIAIYAIHTNLDNIQGGVNHKIADRLDLGNRKVLAPKTGNLWKLVTFVPTAQLQQVRDAIFAAGAGNIGNYSGCSFNVSGTGIYTAGLNTNPFAGKPLEKHQEEEVRVETVFPVWLKNSILSALLRSHPYEEVAYDLYELKNEFAGAGSGLLGELASPMEAQAFLAYLKDRMEAKVIRYTALKEGPVSKVAICGGAGSFLLKTALAAGAQAFVTADFKYHEFFDGEGKILIADIGHYESEKYTKSLLSELILEKFPNFALLLSNIQTNPVNYYF